jgi:hypothetical protein
MMKPSRDAGRPSCLAMNPNNREASAARRVKLLKAFDSLDENIRADLLEDIESLVFKAGISISVERDDARDIIEQVYKAAGLE